MNIPNIDSNVTVTVKFGDTAREYSGTVLKPFRWLTDRQFAMSGDREMPVRVIDAHYITNLLVHSGATRSVSTASVVRQVAGSRGAVYTVTHDSRGVRCSCPGFQFRKSCKHTAAETA